MENEEWISVKEAARIRKCTDANIRYLISNGKLDAKKVDGKWLIRITEEGQQKDASSKAQVSEVIELLKVELQDTKAELQEAKERANRLEEDLRKASERHDTIVLQLSREKQLLLQDMTTPWYKKMFRRGKQEDNTQR
jgi:hypothetical protein